MLVSTSEAANILGISLQGVHYRIKKNLLKSKKENGKILVYIDKQNTQLNTNQTSNIDEILKVKDEQIALLNDNIVWLKNQYENEIKRLENSNNKIIEVFKSEIILLQQAYSEMKNLKLEDKDTKKEQIYKKNEDESMQKVEFISVKEFFALMKQYNLNEIQIKNIILNQIKNNDNRFIYNSKTKELIIHKSDFTDLI